MGQPNKVDGRKRPRSNKLNQPWETSRMVQNSTNFTTLFGYPTSKPIQKVSLPHLSTVSNNIIQMVSILPVSRTGLDAGRGYLTVR